MAMHRLLSSLDAMLRLPLCARVHPIRGNRRMDGAIQTPERENLVAPSFNKEEGSFEGKIGE